jgi:hypothetical protein
MRIARESEAGLGWSLVNVRSGGMEKGASRSRLLYTVNMQFHATDAADGISIP